MNEYGTIQETMTLLKLVHKGLHMNTLEQFYIQQHQYNNTLIPKQNGGEQNPLFEIAYDTQQKEQSTELEDE
ncbi:hypothetical protein Cfor_02918 [Coptotermes formosanus]|uniref:Uncharacterized protein n=1 Tax=Coptotermes formosanus TaxID=36987 RepID=A0A6L2Q221_COPFO|nr:hypothetical protein Cfor_02918 [Coptotermes formosanus]